MKGTVLACRQEKIRQGFLRENNVSKIKDLKVIVKVFKDLSLGKMAFLQKKIIIVNKAAIKSS